jgi:hypothetical protein
MATLTEKHPKLQPRKPNDLRRSQRVWVRVPVAIMGDTVAGSPFSEQCVTIVVNAHGALVTLASKVTIGQTLAIVNLATGEEVACRVAHTGSTVSGKTEIGIEFAQPNPFFWRISFPPPDWETHGAP